MGGIWPEIGIERLFDLSYLTAALIAAHALLYQQLLVPSTLVQTVIVGLAFLAARFVAPRLRSWIERQARRRGLEERLASGARALAPLALPVCWLAFQCCRCPWPRRCSGRTPWSAPRSACSPPGW